VRLISWTAGHFGALDLAVYQNSFRMRNSTTICTGGDSFRLFYPESGFVTDFNPFFFSSWFFLPTYQFSNLVGFYFFVLLLWSDPCAMRGLIRPDAAVNCLALQSEPNQCQFSLSRCFLPMTTNSSWVTPPLRDRGAKPFRFIALVRN